MDALLAKLSYHATSYAIRSCLALTSTLVIQQGSRLLKTVDDDALRAKLGHVQRRLARKIELISPIIESMEFRYTRGNSALEPVVRIGHEIRENIDALAKRLENAASSPPSEAHIELLGILASMKELIVDIDDYTPHLNLWVSAIGGIQTEPASFSPSRLLQASMLVNVGDTQYIIDPHRPMQIGPDFTLAVYMLFRGHVSQIGEPFGLEDGQRKPIWQEVIHKARARLYRIPPGDGSAEMTKSEYGVRRSGYVYQLQLVEDLDDGRVHTFEDENMDPGPFDGVSVAGARELIPIAQISKMFYTDVGRILNITNDDGASSNPVLLLKRDIRQLPPEMLKSGSAERQQDLGLLADVHEKSFASDSSLSESSPQHDIDRQLREESQAADLVSGNSREPNASSIEPSERPLPQWGFPYNLDPEWVALEVFEFDDSHPSTYEDEDDDEDQPISDEDDLPPTNEPPRTQTTSRTSVDGNLVTQLHRMSIASSLPSSRPSSSHSQPTDHHLYPTAAGLSDPYNHHQPGQQPTAPLSPTLIERSPFGAIKTSLSLLEMLLRLTSLQEFEQTTHLAIPDHVLKFYLDESASESGLHGKERWAARAEAERTVGFDPYADAPGRGSGGDM